MSPPTTSPCLSSVWRSTRFSSHRSVRGRGGAIAVLYETHGKGLLRPSWEREADLLHARDTSSNTGPAPLSNLDRRTGCTAVCAWVPLKRELARDKGARFLPPGYSYVNHQTWARRFRDTILHVGADFWYKGQANLWWLGKYPRTLQLLDST